MSQALEATSLSSPSFVWKVMATLGGVAVVLVLGYELLLGVTLAYGELEPAPAQWWGVVLGLGLGVVGPFGVLTKWAIDRHSGTSRHVKLMRLELVGLAVGIPTALVLLAMITVAGII